MTDCILRVFFMFITLHAYLGAPQGVTVLEFAPPKIQEVEEVVTLL